MTRSPSPKLLLPQNPTQFPAAMSPASNTCLTPPGPPVAASCLSPPSCLPVHWMLGPTPACVCVCVCVCVCASCAAHGALHVCVRAVRFTDPFMCMHARCAAHGALHARACTLCSTRVPACVCVHAVRLTDPCMCVCTLCGSRIPACVYVCTCPAARRGVRGLWHTPPKGHPTHGACPGRGQPSGAGPPDQQRPRQPPPPAHLICAQWVLRQTPGCTQTSSRVRIKVECASACRPALGCAWQ